MKISVPLCLCVGTALGIAAVGGVQVSRAQTPASPDLLRRLEAIAALPGEPRLVSAGGVTRSERRLLTLESGSLFQGSRQHRILIVAGLDGDERGTEAALGAVAFGWLAK